MTPSSREVLQHVSDAERLRLLLAAVTDYAIYMVDLDGYVTSWNAGAERIKQYRASEIIGQHYSCFFTLEDQARGLPAYGLAQALEHGRHESEGWRVRKDGSRFLALAVVQPVTTPSGDVIGFAKVTRDITERQAAQQALLESERRFRFLVENVVDYAIYMLDPSGVVINWNSGASRIKGYSADEIIGQHFSRFYTKEDRTAGLPARVLEIATREGKYEAEGWRVRKDGSRFWASVVMDAVRDPSGELIGFAKITRDITERREAQEALRESERQFRLLVSGVTDYALYMLDPNGIITNWNTGAERIKGYRADEIIGQHFSRFYTDSERAAGMPARSLHVAATQGRCESEGWRVRKDGTVFWANAVLDAIRDENGELVGFAKITRDITERRETQKALQEAQAQLSHAQKMEAIGQLTGGVAHDFNNLLMIVSGHIQTIKRQLGDNPRAKRAADAIELATKRGEALTRQLLTFSKRQALNPVVIDLHATIASFQTLLESSIGAAAKLVTTVPPDVWAVEADLNELELALLNLAVNARDAMSGTGVIALTCENATLGPGDTQDNLAGEFVAMTMADTGAGIPPDILPRVFDPFFTTKRNDKGTGLGLSQVYGFAHQSGGTVAIATEVGKGTRVTIYLPRAQARSERVSRMHPSQEAERRQGRALMVEDNPDVAEVTKVLLEELGYEVTAVGDPAAAWHAIAGQKFDFVLSDIVLGGPTSGLAFARELRGRDPDLPIMLATGYSEAAEAAAREFVVVRKPYQLIDLSRAVSKAIAQTRPQDTGAKLLDFRDAKRIRATKGD
ncbi:MAG TPA: PAS domain S-box protein [Xanthobacteraceae bacterium]|nr:PAS domain S-box protein [Xanthobacteraceae bacterium]